MHVEYAGIRDDSVHAPSPVSRGEEEEGNGNMEMMAGSNNVRTHSVPTTSPPPPRHWQNFFGTRRKAGPLFVSIVVLGYLTFFLLLPPASVNPNLALEQKNKDKALKNTTPTNFDVTHLRPLLSTQDVNAADIPSCRGCCGYPAILLYTYQGSEDIFAHVHHTFIDSNAAFLLVDQVTQGKLPWVHTISLFLSV